MDQDAINLSKAIIQHESGGNFTTPGKSQEYGGAQWVKDTWDAQAKDTLGYVPKWGTEEMTPDLQKAVLYASVKKDKDKGLNPAQIAAKWNSGSEKGWENKVGVNKYGVKYDVPAYVKNVTSLYQTYKGQNRVASAGTETVQEDVQPEVSTGRKVLNFMGDITGTRGAGETIGETIAAGENARLLEGVTDDRKRIMSDFLTRINEKEKKGEDTARLKGALQALIEDSPELEKFMPDVTKKTTAQLIADFTQLGIGIVGGSIIPGGSATTRILGGGALGLGAGATSAVQRGETDLGEIGKEGLIGGAIGLATGGLIEGASQAFKGIRGAFKTRTAQEIEDLARNPNITQKEINALSRAEQDEFYRIKRADIDEQYNAVKSERDTFVKQEEARIKQESDELKTQLDQEKNLAATNLKEPAIQSLEDNSNLYMEKVEKGFAEGKNLDTKVSSKKLEDYVESTISDPDMRALAREQFGLDELVKTQPNGNIAYKDITLGDLWKKTKELRQKMSGASKAGTKTFSKAEYETVQNVKHLTDFLEKQGMDLTEANEFWTNWSKLRNRIVNEVKPFDTTGAQKMPIESTLEKSLTNAKGSTAAKQFIDKLEETMGLPPGTIGSDIKEVLEKIDKNKLEKANIPALKKQINDELKAAKLGSVDDLEKQKFNTSQIKKRQNIIKKVILGALGVVGAAKLKQYAEPVL